MLTAHQARNLSMHNYERMRAAKVELATARLEAEIEAAIARQQFSVILEWEPFNLLELHELASKLGYQLESRGRGARLKLVVSWGSATGGK